MVLICQVLFLQKVSWMFISKTYLKVVEGFEKVGNLDETKRRKKVKTFRYESPDSDENCKKGSQKYKLLQRIMTISRIQFSQKCFRQWLHKIVFYRRVAIKKSLLSKTTVKISLKLNKILHNCFLGRVTIHFIFYPQLSRCGDRDCLYSSI